MANELIAVVAAIIGIGVLAQVFSDKFQIPSVIFLIAAGIVLGPQVLGLLQPTVFGGALSAIVGLSVAIIVFEGAFHIRLEQLRAAPAETLRLVTIGAGISFLLTGLTVHYVLGAGWLISFLIGALLVATGPTVITPILEVVPVRDRVATALETEGIVNDVTAAILAIVIFEAIIQGVTEPQTMLRLFAQRLGIGVVAGLLVAGILWYVLEHVNLAPENAPRNARLLTLAGALVAFGLAEFIATESGIAAVATAGIILGNANLPYEENITEFKGDVTLIVLSFIFITLASLLDFKNLLQLGLGGILVVIIIVVIIRPLLMFISTYGNRFTTEEKAFMSFLGPRGIIPASVATLFAIELRNLGMGAAADILVGTVFLVIVVTVV
ncbi:MAG: cation:proton antiporter, partial [Halobacteriaceae archaeon]